MSNNSTDMTFSSSTELETLTRQVLNPYSSKDLKRVKVPSNLLASSRFEFVDLIRGIALILMILSHGTKSLLTWEQYPTWGLVPIHAITKFSSTLFILTFGIALALVYLPHIGTTRWPEKRIQLWWRAIEIMFWYKILTIVQMLQGFTPQEILDALLFKAFPDFVEVLGFYSIALLWLPIFLPIWKQSHFIIKLLFIGAMFYAQVHFSQNYIWQNISLKAILVESNGCFTFGQLSRGPIILIGLLIGEQIYQARNDRWSLFYISLVLISAGSLLLGIHYGSTHFTYQQNLMALAKNAGKHPPTVLFMLFSSGGALVISGLCILGGRILSKILYPITLIGQHSLDVFIFHIIVIFIFYRYLFGYKHTVDYLFALKLSVVLIVLSAMWAGILKCRK